MGIPHRRVVITGIGVVAPGDPGRKAFWQRLTDGRPAFGPISFFDPAPFRSGVAAECEFDPAREGLSVQEIRRLDRAAQLLLVAADEAVADSGADFGALGERTGVSIGTAVGCTLRLEEEYVVLSDQGRCWEIDPGYVVPHQYDYFVPSSLAAEVGVRFGTLGPATVVSAGCTSGIDAVGHACQLVREGSADVMLAGGTDAPISPITVACFDAIRATSPHNDDPVHAMRPFDRNRSGFVLGEGSAVLVLEEYEAARRRGAHVYAEIAGYATRCNAYHMTGLRSDGAELAAAMETALATAETAPGGIDYVNAHGTATRQNDRHETAAIKRALGAHAATVPVSSVKSMLGHSLGAIGAIEIAASSLALEYGVIPPTANLTEPDPELDLDYVPVTARESLLRTVLTVGSGFGGFQSAMVLRGRA
ncbi:beta-ketoacyl-[acyl-carrier-protein] synthase family protein [Amycolatopsis acidicola]|uniref:Beta-ketoacyl-[acyl-carrier-protein] synthase family protein n=1 Tax=Amycolatopsis acidicola TaxID=2596893 RepID=A0A5N0VMW6_9PSEU|nr:beta-ketoacyl-[acyl-carrier-protein] synthase family protein [Amycolatopsis acidicola]KAA9166510.1 beta-ketoacyl-[acyl-carrier-protein] synthase family protein [Amycolatopsis acidicola]